MKATDATRQKIRVATALKARGQTWSDVAQALGYASEDAAQKLKINHPKIWTERFQEAMDELLREEIEQTALSTQLNIISTHEHTENPKLLGVVQRAAHSLLKHTEVVRQMRIDITVGQREASRVDDELIEDAKAQINAIAGRVLGREPERLALPDGQGRELEVSGGDT
ncbi:MAG: hypothetical protein ACOC7S_00785 [Planctomycetota bacterium]